MGEFEDHFHSELGAAIDAYNDRKMAATSGSLPDHGPGNVIAERDVLRKAFSGADLDLDELAEIELIVGAHGVEAMVRGISPIKVISGSWIDGLNTGIILERRRSR